MERRRALGLSLGFALVLVALHRTAADHVCIHDQLTLSTNPGTVGNAVMTDAVDEIADWSRGRQRRSAGSDGSPSDQMTGSGDSDASPSPSPPPTRYVAMKINVTFDPSMKTSLTAKQNQLVQKAVEKAKQFVESRFSVWRVAGGLLQASGCHASVAKAIRCTIQNGGQPKVKREICVGDWNETMDWMAVSHGTVCLSTADDAFSFPEELVPETTFCYLDESDDDVSSPLSAEKENVACTEQGTTTTNYRCQKFGKGGLNATDFFLYVAARNTSTCTASGGTAAYATSCNVHQATGRPVTAYANFCPDHIESTNGELYLERIALHEIVHALGFSPKAVSDSFCMSANSLTDDCVALKNQVDNTTFTLKTPRATRMTREHFGCPTAAGAKVENADAKPGGHFEERLFPHSLMSPIIRTGFDAVFDLFTAVVLEDSLWYQINKTALTNADFGKAAGCGIFNESRCSAFPNLFCTESGRGCTASLKQIESCIHNAYVGPRSCSIRTAEAIDTSLSSFIEHKCDSSAAAHHLGNAMAAKSRYRAETFGNSSFCAVSTIQASSAAEQSNLLSHACYSSVCVGTELYLRIGSELQPCQASRVKDFRVYLSNTTASSYFYVVGQGIGSNTSKISSFRGQVVCNTALVNCCRNSATLCNHTVQRLSPDETFPVVKPMLSKNANPSSGPVTVIFQFPSDVLNSLFLKDSKPVANFIAARSASASTKHFLDFALKYAVLETFLPGKGYDNTFKQDVVRHYSSVICSASSCNITFALPFVLDKISGNETSITGTELAASLESASLVLQYQQSIRVSQRKFNTPDGLIQSQGAFTGAQALPVILTAVPTATPTIASATKAPVPSTTVTKVTVTTTKPTAGVFTSSSKSVPLGLIIPAILAVVLMISTWMVACCVDCRKASS